MKSKLFITALLTFLIILVTACVPTPGDTPTPVETVETPIMVSTASESVTEIPTGEVGTETQAFTATPAVAETATGTASSNMTLSVNEQGASAPYLVDGQGRSMYSYMNDTQNSNISSCIDDCAVEWPPLIVTGTPAAGTGVNPARLGTIRRDDGSSQATYNGWPLYYYNMDTIPGTTNGQSYNGVWFLVSPTGEPIQQ